MTSKTGIDFAAIISEIEDEYGVEVEVRGGGKGWTATATGDKVTTVKADNKATALSLLSNSLQEGEGEDVEDAEEVDLDGCSEECQNANPNSPCTCKCGGANHPGSDVVVFGPKPCRCGCGEITKRRYVPGHDARHHFALRAAAAGLDVEAFRAQLKAERNKVAAAKRREKRAADKAAGAEEVEGFAPNA